jgi:hypothetical protein
VVQQTGQHNCSWTVDVVVMSSCDGGSAMVAAGLVGAAQVGVAGVVVAQAVGLAGDVEHDAAVQQPVEQRGGDGRVAQDVAPAGDRPVGGDDGAGLAVALGDDLEQRGGAFGG